MADLVWKGPGVLEGRPGEVIAHIGDRLNESRLDPRRVETFLRNGQAAYLTREQRRPLQGENHG